MGDISALICKIVFSLKVLSLSRGTNDFIEMLIPYHLNFSLCHRCLFWGLGEKKEHCIFDTSFSTDFTGC